LAHKPSALDSVDDPKDWIAALSRPPQIGGCHSRVEHALDRSTNLCVMSPYGEKDRKAEGMKSKN
jgi:hypothetical protein